MADYTLDDALIAVKGVGPALQQKYKKHGLISVGDLLYYFPRRYDDYSNVTPIGKLKPGKVSIRATISHIKGRYIRGGLHITEAIAEDSTGSVRLVWFNQPYRESGTERDKLYFVSGDFGLRRGRLSILNPNMELAGNFPVNTARIVPVYRESKAITSAQIRKTMRAIFTHGIALNEFLPAHIVKNQKLIPLQEALFKKHFPDTSDDLARADERLGFEELFELIITSMYSRNALDQETSLKIPFDQKLAQKFVSYLPFKLTDAQRKSIWQIYTDMQKTRPMNRLLEGDVGSGKTVVSAMAAAMVIQAGYQVALMAPTEILARQHADTMHKILEPLGFGSSVTLLLGSSPIATKKNAYKNISSGNVRLLIGTHALIQENVSFSNLGLVVVDEQHRFGVEQRKRLLKASGHMPHMLSMTATPIPRSLALTVFGEVDVSILNEKPATRQPVLTKLINPTDRLKIYESIREELKQGKQVFVVCPVIGESKTGSMKSVSDTYDELRLQYFKNFSVGLLHGKLKAEEKQVVMQRFINGTLDILVSTTVIEVGVDVPNASIMMIESPERFGLAQLHQLRGRIGRGKDPGVCYLMLSDSGNVSKRLKAIAEYNDGFKLAELDLRLRGAGALYGTSQHGLLDLRIANFNDVALISRAREEAKQLLESDESLIQYPHIKQRIKELQHVVHLN